MKKQDKKHTKHLCESCKKSYNPHYQIKIKPFRPNWDKEGYTPSFELKSNEFYCQQFYTWRDAQ